MIENNKQIYILKIDYSVEMIIF